MNAAARLRGQPVLMLAVLLGGWVALRAAFWDTPFRARTLELPETLLAGSGREELGAAQMRPSVAFTGPVPRLDLQGNSGTRLAWNLPASSRPPAGPEFLSFRSAVPSLNPLRPSYSQLSLPELATMFYPADQAVTKPALQDMPFSSLNPYPAAPDSRRWSADGWVLLRRDTTTALTSGRGSYGGSQAGAVLRYGFAPSSRFAPAAYARVSQALGGAKESELALGISARPLSVLPVRAAAEVRGLKAGDRTFVRPAAFAVTEIAPVALPLGFVGEAYGQAGYVGGKYASAFIDGHIRMERKVVEFGDTGFSAGGGAWGGAQEGAARLDIGPSASFSLPLGEISSRISVDYRFRIAGQAQPANGPALTISAGF